MFGYWRGSAFKIAHSGGLFCRLKPCIQRLGAARRGRANSRASAAALRVSRPSLSSLLNGKADLSVDMALRIEKAFGVKMDTLLRMQVSYGIAQTRKREKQIRVQRIRPLAIHA